MCHQAMYRLDAAIGVLDRRRRHHVLGARGRLLQRRGIDLSGSVSLPRDWVVDLEEDEMLVTNRDEGARFVERSCRQRGELNLQSIYGFPVDRLVF